MEEKLRLIGSLVGRDETVILTITRLNKKPAFGVIFLIGGGFSLCLNEHEDVDKDVGGFLLRLH